MGEIADMILDGTLDYQTGEYIGEPCGYPRTLEPCEETKPKKISIIIPVLNQWEFTSQALSSMLKITAYPDWEIIVVDNGSSDATPKELFLLEKQHTGKLRYLRFEKNLGFSAANNAGADIAEGEYLLFLKIFF